LVDWSQNDEHKTTVCVYSLRARPHPTVSTPVSWAEVGRCLQSGDATKLEFTAPQVLERVERQGDLFAPVLTLHQQLPQSAESVATARRAQRTEPPSAIRKLPPARKRGEVSRSERSA
jgi:bifunctional non-homologous end joining protein LigD